MRRLILVAGIMCMAAIISSCTMSTSGGTTDTGNARVAAVIYTADGERAANAVVTACPEDYTTPIDEGTTAEDGYRLRTVTDDTGYFSFPEIENGDWYVEVNDLVASAVRFGITVDSGKETVLVDTALAPYAALSGNVGSAEDSLLKRFCVFDGLDRRIPVAADGSFKADDLPEGTYTCRIVASADNWEERNFQDVTVISGDEVKIAVVDTTPEPELDTVRIVLNTSASGAEVAGTVIDFPVLLRLDSSVINFERTGENGELIRFYNRNDSVLPFTIEQWSSENRNAMIWVVVDTVYGNDSVQTILMVCGDTSAEVSDSPETAPFDSVTGHVACYHFEDDLVDATGNGFHGVDSGSSDTTGIIGRGRAFNGKSDYITIGELPDRESGTISFWFRPNFKVNGAMSTSQGIWGKKISDSTDFTISLQGTDYWPVSEGAGALVTKQEVDGVGYYLTTPRRTYEKGVWYHAVWCWGNDGDSLYVNGTLEATESGSLTIGSEGAEEIGRSYYDESNLIGGGPCYFNGSLDEFRIEKVCHSPAWVKLSYMNQRKDDRLIIIR